MGLALTTSPGASRSIHPAVPQVSAWQGFFERTKSWVWKPGFSNMQFKNSTLLTPSVFFIFTLFGSGSNARRSGNAPQFSATYDILQAVSRDAARVCQRWDAITPPGLLSGCRLLSRQCSQHDSPTFSGGFQPRLFSICGHSTHFLTRLINYMQTKVNGK